MIGWIKSLFGLMDRQQVAAERAAVALEDIASDLEAVRDQMRARLGIEVQPAKVLVSAVDEDEKKPRGRSRS